MNVAQRYRWLYKPLVFIAAGANAARLLLGAFGKSGFDLGADPVDTILHSCGKTALTMLLITLLVTPLRQLTGFNNLLRLRRMLGLFAFFYAVMHFVTYSWLDQGLDFAAIGADIVKRPYITIGMAALLMLIPLAITSTNGMMRRLGKRWVKLHWLIYPIAMLGVWHYYWQVKRDIRQPLLYAGVLAVLLGYRIFKARYAPARARERT